MRDIVWVYIKTEPQLWTAGFYEPNGEWHADSDYGNPGAAATRVAWLNGGRTEPFAATGREE